MGAGRLQSEGRFEGRMGGACRCGGRWPHHVAQRAQRAGSSMLSTCRGPAVGLGSWYQAAQPDSPASGRTTAARCTWTGEARAERLCYASQSTGGSAARAPAAANPNQGRCVLAAGPGNGCWRMPMLTVSHRSSAGRQSQEEGTAAHPAAGELPLAAPGPARPGARERWLSGPLVDFRGECGGRGRGEAVGL